MKNVVAAASAVAIAAWGAYGASQCEPNRLKDEFPFGVFWAWERNEFNYTSAGLTHEQYAEKELKLK